MDSKRRTNNDLKKSIHKPELEEVYEPKQTERLEIILTRQSFVVVDLVHLFLRKTQNYENDGRKKIIKNV